ncbi:MAG: hypothetical protein U0V74_08705 [Chitinophagales bacterium]
MKTLNKAILILFISFVSSYAFSQAQLKIKNISLRTMTVKVMFNSGGVYKTVTIEPYGSEIVYFNSTGYYYTKTKAVYPNKSTIYQKGKAFEVYNGSDGYSVLTITFSINETSESEITGGKQISKEEFDKN